MTKFSIFNTAIALTGSRIMFVSCNNCETCVQYKVPMDAGTTEAIAEEEVCGRKDLIDRENEIINDVTFDGDSDL